VIIPFPLPVKKPEFPPTDEGLIQFDAWVNERKPFVMHLSKADQEVYQRARKARNVRRCSRNAVNHPVTGPKAREDKSVKAKVSNHRIKVINCLSTGIKEITLLCE
jgi:hypothetical protein